MSDINENEQQETNLFEEPINTNSISPDDMPKRKVPKWIIPVCGVVILLIIAVTTVFCSPALSNSFALLTMNPTSYYQKVERKNLSSKINLFTKDYDSTKAKLSENIKNGTGLNQLFTVKVDPTLTNMFGLSDLKSIGLNNKVMYKNGKSKMDASIMVNETKALNFNIFSDLDNGLLYYLIPTLNEAYLKFPIDELMKTLNYDDSLNPYYLKNIQTTANPLITEKFLNNTLNRYTEILIDNINDVTMEKNVEIKTNDVSGKYTQLNITVSSKEQYAILEQILKTAQEDSELSNVLAKGEIATTEEYHNKITELQEQLKTNKENFLTETNDLFIKVWVTNKGNVAGHEFTFNQNMNATTFGYRSEQDKTDVVMESWLSISDKNIINVKSRGAKKKNVYTGNMDILFTNPNTGLANTTKVAIDNFLMNPLTSEIDGKLTITNSLLGILNIGANITGNREKMDITFDVLQGDKSLISFLLTSSTIDYEEITLPTNNDKSYNAVTEMNQYIITSDINGFLAKLKENIKSDSLNQFIEQLANYM